MKKVIRFTQTEFHGTPFSIHAKLLGKFCPPFWHNLRMPMLIIDATALINRDFSGDLELGGKNVTALFEPSPYLLPHEKSRRPESYRDFPLQVL